MDEWHFIAERKIREALQEGVFENLEGAGAPLDLSQNPFEDPSDRLAYRLLKNNGFAPAWIEEAKEIEAEAGRLRAHLEPATEDYQTRVAALNRRIFAFNLKAPSLSQHKPRFKRGQ